MSMVYKYMVHDFGQDWSDGEEFDSFTLAQSSAEPGQTITELSYAFDDSEIIEHGYPSSASSLSRETCIRILEFVGIECFDDEDTETLRETVRVNCADGTIDAGDFTSMLDGE
jgi:hypothetical protein